MVRDKRVQHEDVVIIVGRQGQEASNVADGVGTVICLSLREWGRGEGVHTNWQKGTDQSVHLLG